MLNYKKEDIMYTRKTKLVMKELSSLIGQTDEEKLLIVLKNLNINTLPPRKGEERIEDWTVLLDIDPDDDKLFPPDELEAVPFLEVNEFALCGEELFKRAKKHHADLNYRQARFFFKNMDRDIPKEWKSRIIVFPGTVWCDNNWRFRISQVSLFFRTLSHPYLDLDFDSRHLLLRPKTE